MSLFAELRRRNVLRVATAYAVTAWLIIQVADTVLPFFGFSDGVIRNVIVLLVLGFIPAVVLAWIFRLTADGIERDRGSRDAATEQGATRILDRAIIAVLLLGISYFAVDKFVIAPERTAERDADVAEQARAEAVAGFFGDRSIAVMPFANFSDDPAQQNFADGIAEEVLNLLARIRELRVISRSSTFALRGSKLEVPDIAKRLDVGHVLEGSVRKAGAKVRVTVQLIDARSDTHLWSHTYTETLDDVFRIQDEIAADVATNLQIKLLKPLPRSRAVDPEVRSLVEQAKQLAEVRPAGVGTKMYGLLSRALEIDPDYVPALNLMAVAYFFQAGEGLSLEESDRLQADILARVQKLDPDSGYLDNWYAWDKAFAGDFEDAAALYDRALAKDITDSNHIRLAGYFARRIGKLDVAVRLGRLSVAIDPLCYQCQWRLAESLMYVGDYDGARQQMQRYMASATGHRDDYARILLLDGKAQEALRFLASVDRETLDGFDVMSLDSVEAMARYSLGETERAEALLSDLIARDFEDHRAQLYCIAEAAAWMGKKDLAFEKLFEMQATNFNYLQRRAFSPIWRKLHDDPRWLEWRAAYGLSQSRLDAIVFDPELPE